MFGLLVRVRAGAVDRIEAYLSVWGGLRRMVGGAHVGAHLAVKVVNTGISTGKYITRYCEILELLPLILQ